MSSRYFVLRADDPLKTALSFHAVAGELAAQPLRQANLPADAIDLSSGRMASAVVLEALAIELLLKVRRERAGLPFIREHKHKVLFDSLPQSEQDDLRRCYETGSGHRKVGRPQPLPVGAIRPAMTVPKLGKGTLVDSGLELSSKAFEQWRYAHEHHGGNDVVQADFGEMQFIFDLLRQGL
ncbi:MAG TPA: hypothetical protein VJA16_18010 [Thermoanaerobaculia bacterium]